MSKKAVYNNKMLAIYISGDDFKKLLDSGKSAVPIYIGKVKTDRDWISVDLSFTIRGELYKAYQLEYEAIETVRAEHAKPKVHYLTTEETQRRLKHGKG